MERLKNKTAIITGGAGGFGARAAEKFAGEGAAVAIFDYNEAAGEKKAEELVGKGFKACFCKVDVSNRENVAEACRRVEQAFGTIDILVNNAGIMRKHGCPADQDPDHLETMKTMAEINFYGAFYCAAEVVPYMQKNGGGSIINVSSSSSLVAVPGNAAYTMTKHAVNGLTIQFAVSYGPDHIRTNALMPGMCIKEGMSQEILDYYADMVPLKRLATADDVANAMLFLASDESSYFNGAMLLMDGGYLRRSCD